MNFWIAKVLKREREAAAISEKVVAALLNTNERTIERLETGERWGRDIDRAVLAYAYALGLDDSRHLWQLALDEWNATGAAPEFSSEELPGLPGMRFLRPLRDESRRQPKAHGEPEGKPRANPRPKREAR